MDDYRPLPFNNLNDTELVYHINNDLIDGNGNIPLDILDTLCFSPFSYNEDIYNSDLDPDNFLLNSLNYNNPSCEYVFPDEPHSVFDDFPVNTFSY